MQKEHTLIIRQAFYEVQTLKYQFMWQKKKDHCVFTLKHTNTHAKGMYPRLTRYNKDTSSLMICTEMQSGRDTIKALKKTETRVFKALPSKDALLHHTANSPKDFPHSSKHRASYLQTQQPIRLPCLAH